MISDRLRAQQISSRNDCPCTPLSSAAARRPPRRSGLFLQTSVVGAHEPGRRRAARTQAQGFIDRTFPLPLLAVPRYRCRRPTARGLKETIQHTLFECEAFEEEREVFLSRLYSVCPLARQLTDEGRCRLVMGNELPREIENPLYRYLSASSQLRLGVLTERGVGS